MLFRMQIFYSLLMLPPSKPQFLTQNTIVEQLQPVFFEELPFTELHSPTKFLTPVTLRLLQIGIFFKVQIAASLLV
jgi:hypothetical protein